MGSGNCGLYQSLPQSVSRVIRISFPISAVEHASVGEFTSTNRLKSGGHGQAGIEELERRGIDYVIEKTFSNGVRSGYVPYHSQPFKRKSGGQLWFPKDWSETDIRRAGRAVLKAHKGKIKNGTMITGWYNGVRVGIIVNGGQIKTVFPTKEQE